MAGSRGRALVRVVFVAIASSAGSALAAARAAPPGSALAATLSSAVFYNSGVSRREDGYTWVPFSVSYMEPDNVTAPNTGWGLGGYSYLYKLNATQPPPPPPGGCGASAAGLVNLDVPGFDRGEKRLAPSANVSDCAAFCCETPGCAAFVYEPKSDTTFGGCAVGTPCCFLKSQWGPTAPKPAGFGIFAGNISGAPEPPSVVDPVLGVRSAPPLGGVSAGSIELRADGSLREWLILNQGPAGSSKFGLVDDAWLAVSVGGATKVLRTRPPAYVPAGLGVAALNFSGSYPLTRLVPIDADLARAAGAAAGAAAGSLALFAYSTYVPGDLAASALPAIAFTLSVTNGGADPLPVALALSVPLGGLMGCTMAGDGKGGAGGASAANASACLHACAAAPASCASWQFDSLAAACTLNSDVPLTAFSPTTACGLAGAGGWSAADGAVSLDMRAPSGAVGTSTGDVTLRATADGDLAPPPPPPGAAATFAAADDPAAILAAFAAGGGGSFAPDAPGLAAGGADFTRVQAAHGAAASAGVVAPGGTATFTVVFAWSFPYRSWNGGPTSLGNGYSAIYTDSAMAAAHLATPAQLQATAAAINAHHEAVASAASPAPEWLKDFLVNSFSHAHMLMWFADGRMRQYEAYSCDDVDSVHNDYQRHNMYLWNFPVFEASKLSAWSTFAQAADGHVIESLAGGCGGGKPGDLDAPSGRLMGDTTSLFVVEVGEWWHLSGDGAALAQRWPAVKRAVAWMVSNANITGLPRLLETTYDHFGFGSRESVAYNAHIFLASMLHAAEMAAEVGDAAVEAAVLAALARAQAATTSILWNSTFNYYRAFNGGDAIFTDTLYGLMIAHAHGFGLAGVDADKVAAHLDFEWARNQDAFGMRVISNPVMEDSVWMNGPPTWTYLALAQLAAASPGGVVSSNASALADALEPMRRMVSNYRDRIADLWNLRALTHSETEGNALEHGGPREQGHYGFALTAQHLLLLLSGQQARLHRGQLSFAPIFAPPYSLPVLLLGTEGSLAADAAGRLTLSIAFGSLQLPAGGLSVHGAVYGGGAISLGPGQSVSW